MDRRRFSLRDQLDQVIPNRGSFVWELGCGHGHFLTAYAKAHPGDLCIGIDIVSERIERAVRKRNRAKLTNLHFLRADAQLFLEILPPNVSFSELLILFPDPWPKVRHHKHRILQPAFLSAAAERGADNCRLSFRTDFEPYFEAGKRIIETHPQWTISDEPWPFEADTVFQNRAPAYQSLIARRSQPRLVS